MFKVPYGQDPYSVIGKYIRDHITAIEDIIAVIEIDGITTNQLFMVDMNEGDYFIWDNDWWEGEKDIALIDFFPVSEAINPSAQPEQRWIPCEKRLPDKNGWYIVTIRNNISYMVNTLYWRNGKGWVDNIRKNMFDLYDIYSKLVGRKINPEDECVYWNLDDVVAWMLLPEAYKEGDSDD